MRWVLSRLTRPYLAAGATLSRNQIKQTCNAPLRTGQGKQCSGRVPCYNLSRFTTSITFSSLPQCLVRPKYFSRKRSKVGNRGGCRRCCIEIYIAIALFISTRNLREREVFPGVRAKDRNRGECRRCSIWITSKYFKSPSFTTPSRDRSTFMKMVKG